MAYYRLDGKTLNRYDVIQLANQTAHFLRETLNLNKGDRIGIISPNSTLYAPVVLGILKAGCICVTLNPIYSAAEMEHPVADSDLKMIFAHPMTLKSLREALSKLGRSFKLPNGQPSVWIINDADAVQAATTGELDFREALQNKDWPTERVNSTEDVSFIVYSSGTSGKPKGVMLTHDNLISNTETFNLVSRREGGPYQTAIGVLPFFHIFGLNILVLSSFLHGFRVVVVPRFDINVFCAAVQRFHANMSVVVPPILLALARHPDVDKYDMSSLTAVISGAAPLGRELCEEVQHRLPKLGLAQGYGLSETAPVLLRCIVDRHRQHLGSAGQIVPFNEIRLVNYDGKDVAYEQGSSGNPGEIWVRGRSVMKGYLNNPDATNECMTPDGWFKTGDIAIVKDGFFYIVDRMKELIKYKGFQVPPAELEDMLLAHPNIADCAVIGLYKEDIATELPMAFVVPKKGVIDLVNSSQSEKDACGNEIANWLDSKVANHKKLRGGVVFIDEIPKSQSGKILRRVLREKANNK